MAIPEPTQRAAYLFTLNHGAVQPFPAAFHQQIEQRVFVGAISDVNRVVKGHQTDGELNGRKMRTDQQDAAALFMGFDQALESRGGDTLLEVAGIAPPGHADFHDADAIGDERVTYQFALLFGRQFREAQRDVDLADVTAPVSHTVHYQADALADLHLPGERQLGYAPNKAIQQPGGPVAGAQIVAQALGLLFRFLAHNCCRSVMAWSCSAL